MTPRGVNRRRFIRLAGGSAAVTTLAGCLGGEEDVPGPDDGDGDDGDDGDDTDDATDDDGDSSPDDDALLLGALYPLSGDLAELGQESFRGVELAVQERNDDGGIDGQQIEIVSKDAPDADAGVSAVESLATVEEVPVTVGSYSSTISAAATRRAATYDLPYWELGAIADVVTDENPGNVFRTCPTASFFGRDGSDLAAEVVAPALDTEPEDLNYGLMYESGEYGNAVGAAVKARAEELGIPIVEEIEYEADTSDLSSAIQRLDQADVDVLNHTGYLGDIDLLWTQLSNLDVFIPAVIGNGAGYSLQSYVDNVGDTAALGVLNMDFTQYNTNPDYAPGIVDFVDLYEGEYGERPQSGHSLANYFGAKVLFDALEAADSLDLDAIRDAALGLDQEPGNSPTGWGVGFDEETQQNERIEVVGHQWQEDEYEDDIWHPDVSDGRPGLYTVFPEEARLDMIDVAHIPQPDYTEQ